MVSQMIKLDCGTTEDPYVLRHVDRPYASATSYIEDPQLRVVSSRGHEGRAMQLIPACKEDNMV